MTDDSTDHPIGSPAPHSLATTEMSEKPEPIASPASEPKRWHAGTLTYTTAGLSVLFFWLLWGDFGFYLKERAAPATLTVLLKHYKASDYVVGLLLVGLPQLMQIIVGPVISYYSDRHRGRWGRRIPFLLTLTPVAVISMIGMAFSPVIGRWFFHETGGWLMGEHASIIASFGIFWGVFEFCSFVCTFAFLGLVNDVVPRPVISRFFGLFRVISVSAGLVFSSFLFGRLETHSMAIFLGLGALYGVLFTAMCLRVKEGGYPPLIAPAAGAARGLVPVARMYFRECFALSYYRWYFISTALFYMATVPINTFYIYYARSLHMSMDSLGNCISLLLVVSLIQSYPIGWLSDKFHPIRLTIVALGLYATATLLAFMLVHNAATFGIAYVVSGSLTGFWVTAVQPLWSHLFPTQKYTTFYSAMFIGNSLAQLIIGPVSGWLLDYMNHEYRYLFLSAGILTVLSLLATLIVYRRFMAYGGPKGYDAPEIGAVSPIA